MSTGARTQAREDAASGQRRLEEGQAHRSRGDLDAAATSFFEALVADPQRFEAGAALAETIGTLVADREPASPPPRATGTLPTFSVVVCSNRPGRFARVTACYRRCLAGTRWEMIGVHDARSLAEGYQRALARTRGQVVILSHDDVDVLAPDFAVRLAHALQHFDLVGVAGATRLAGPAWGWAGHPDVHGWIAHRPGGTGPWRPAFWSVWPRVADAVTLDGVLLAARRQVFDAVRFDAATFDGFHVYDVDFAARAAKAGLRVGVCGDLAVVHESLGAYDERWRHYAQRFVAKFPGCHEPLRPAHRYETALPTRELAYAFFLRLEALARAWQARGGR